MVCSIKDFSNTWTTEANNSIKLFKALSDESLNKELVPEYKTLCGLALHIIGNIYGIATKLGLDVSEKSDPCDKVSIIVDDYQKISDDFLRQLQSNWTDNMLKDKVSIFGMELSRSEVLAIMLLHQTHHRGQMTVLMRLAGLDVPGMYGPSASDKKKQK